MSKEDRMNNIDMNLRRELELLLFIQDILIEDSGSR
jgi:hypothetical protein